VSQVALDRADRTQPADPDSAGRVHRFYARRAAERAGNPRAVRHRPRANAARVMSKQKSSPGPYHAALWHTRQLPPCGRTPMILTPPTRSIAPMTEAYPLAWPDEADSGAAVLADVAAAMRRLMRRSTFHCAQSSPN